MTNNKKPFSFTSFLNGDDQNRYQRSQGNNARVNAPSVKQTQYYMDLCDRKKIKPKDINKFTFDQLGKEIEALRALPDPASPRQLQKIEELVKEITDLGGEIKPFSQGFLDRLTGGREGTASQLIDTLMTRRTELNEVAPPSDAQIQILVEWFLCPDIPFESHGVEKKVYLEKLDNYSSDSDTPLKLEERPWRLVTAEEFATRIKKHMTKKEASAFIDQWRSVFYDWRKTRITSQQANYIRELEKRLANMYVPKQVEFAIDQEGNVIELKTGSSHDARSDVQTSGYTPLEDIQLAQMSYEDASTMIDQLKSEVSRKDAYQFGNIYDSTQQDFQDKTVAVNVKDENDARVREYTLLNDLIYKLEAVVGYEHMELHDVVKESVLEGVDERSQEARDMIKSFMQQSIDFKRGEEQVKNDIGRLYTMSEDSLIATDIVEELAQEIFSA